MPTSNNDSTFLSGESNSTTSSSNNPISLLSSIASNNNKSNNNGIGSNNFGFDASSSGSNHHDQNQNLKSSSKIQILHEETFDNENDKNNSNDESGYQKLNQNQDSNHIIDDNHDGGDDDDGPPPLFLDSTSLRLQQFHSKEESQSSPPSPTVQNNGQEISTSSLMEQMMKDAIKARKKKENDQNEATRKNSKNANFGLKKGFLTSKQTKKKRSSTKTSNSSSDSSSKNDCAENREKSCEKPGSDNYQDPPDIIYELDTEGNLIQTPLAPNKDNHQTIPTIRPKNHNQKLNAKSKNPLYIDEVQQAMKKSTSQKYNISNYLSSNAHEWNTPDLMEQISRNKILSSGMANPKFTAALEVFQSNPKKAKEQFRNHPDVIEFLNEFCKIMGNHFTELGKKHDKKDNNNNVSSIRSKKQGKDDTTMGPMAKKAVQKEKERQKQNGRAWDDNMSHDDKKQLDKIMADQELTSLLMDKELQSVMDECTRIPGKMRMFMVHPEFGPKLKKLIHAGLLRVV